MAHRKVVCPQCEAAYQVPDHVKLTRFRCKKCKAVFEAGNAESEKTSSSLPSVDGTMSDVTAARKEVDSHFPDAPAIGDVIGDCKITDFLGEGGMGVVYKAVRQTLKRIVALKVVPESVNERCPTYGPRLISEAQAAAGLQHPNITMVYNAGRDGGTVFLEMEFVPGQSLKGVIKKAPMSEIEATRVIRSTAKALSYASENGIVHRDIKPDNIMLTNDGVVKVADFGLAGNVWDKEEAGLAEDATKIDPKQTKAGAIMGTLGYMSPQQCRGEPLDGRTDVYALGATFYALLCGHPPFQHPNPVVVLKLHQTEPVPDIREETPHVSEHAWEVIQKAMAKELTDRYQTGDEMAEALAAAPGAEGEEAEEGDADEFMASLAKMLGGAKKK